MAAHPRAQPESKLTVYAVHQYTPFLYTHQQPGQNRPYPGYFDVDWDNQLDSFDWNRLLITHTKYKKETKTCD